MHDDPSTTEAKIAKMNDTDSTEEACFAKSVFHVLIDNVVTGLTVRFNAAKKLAENLYCFGNITQRVNVSYKIKQEGWLINILQTLMMKILHMKCNIYQFYTKPIWENMG